MHLAGAGAGAVDLVDDHDRTQAVLEGFAQDESGLGHRAFESVDQQEAAVGHFQHAFDFAAEVGVAGRVDEVDFGTAVGDGDVLGQDGDAAFAFLGVGVEDALAFKLAVAELPALAQELVDQGCFTVVDVCDDGDVSDVRILGCHPGCFPRSRHR